MQLGSRKHRHLHEHFETQQLPFPDETEIAIPPEISLRTGCPESGCRVKASSDIRCTISN